MELIERAEFLASLKTKFKNVVDGEGHCVFVCGEAGIGKTSLVKTFCRERKNNCMVFQGTCDALFIPRPLAPIYEIVWQLRKDIWEDVVKNKNRAELFNRLFHELEDQKETALIVIEDIHWADEATLDFIKFLARRVTRLRCLFILTYRDDEIHSHHPLRHLLGQLSPDTFTRLQLTPLSRQAVEKMAVEKGYSGEDVYSISGGNPFYVNEILASYSHGIPDNIKDSILSVYNRQDETTKQIWQILSVLPTGFETAYLEEMEQSYAPAIRSCLDTKILTLKEGLIFFKHELYRRTIERSLSPLVRVELNKRILDLFLEKLEQKGELERIIHHAKNANEYELVVKYSPLAARQAASVGAHIEASKLYLSAIEYYQGSDKDILIQFYESYAYECYVTNQIREAIIFQEKALRIWEEKNDTEKIGNCMRFLSRLWWYEGNRKKAETYGSQAIEILSDQPSSKAKAIALSNMSQLKMLSDQRAECMQWGEKAIMMAKDLGDEETLAHALNNIGIIQMRVLSTRQEGIRLMQQSLEIALKNSYEEHAVRAYINLASNAVVMKDYVLSKKILNEGIQYCEERDMDGWRTYLVAYKARHNLGTGNWDDACRIADTLIKDEDALPIVKILALVIAATIKMRRGDKDVLPLLNEAREKAFEMMEPQRISPVMIALLEYEWITGSDVIKKADLDCAIEMLSSRGNVYEKSEFSFWLLKARKLQLPLDESCEGYKVDNQAQAVKAAGLWRQLGCPYEQALTLFEGSDNDKRTAIEIVHRLGAEAIYEKMKFQMRASGIKSIPRGIRKTTKANPANLTEREMNILQLLKDGLQNKEIAASLFISPKTVSHHIYSIFFKLDVHSRTKAVHKAIHLNIVK